MISPPSILQAIVAHKRREVAACRAQQPLKELENSPYFARRPVSLRAALAQAGSSGLIAEFKRKSPSLGWLHRTAPVAETAAGYLAAGAAALSILTDTSFFGGAAADLVAARQATAGPILRKDFVVEEYQVLEAKSLGADAVLLIAAVLSPADIRHLGRLAKSLGLEVLLEVHDAAELARSADATAVDLIGVNNRNLHDFSTCLDTSLALAAAIPAGFGRVSESGISSAAAIRQLRAVGYEGFLLGQAFMQQPHPAQACAALVQALRATGAERELTI